MSFPKFDRNKFNIVFQAVYKKYISMIKPSKLQKFYNKKQIFLIKLILCYCRDWMSYSKKKNNWKNKS